MHQPIPKELLLQRGSCCGKNCVNCPYIPQWQRGSTNVKKKFSTDR